MNQLAVQMYTLRDLTKTRDGFAECLEIIHGIGYAGVQLSAVGCMNGENPEVSAAEARELLDANGLRCVATHRSWDDLRFKTDQEIAFHQTLGCTYTAIGGAWQYGKNAEALPNFLIDAKPVVETLRAAGIRFGYHNHSYEFAWDEVRRRNNYEALIDAEWLQLEQDTYWVQYAGASPAACLARVPGRVDVIHVKDMQVGPDDKPRMAPIGEGNLDWDAILAAGRASGVQWYVVEQDEVYRDPFDCLSSSFDYLAGKGLAG